jgi:hypothetical protein
MNNNKVEMTKSTIYEIRVGLGVLLKIFPFYCSLFHVLWLEMKE